MTKAYLNYKNRVKANADLLYKKVMEMSKSVRTIKTSFIYPPIPIRTNDWCAWYDDEGEEAGRYGYGSTEAEAILDLKVNYEETLD